MRYDDDDDDEKGMNDTSTRASTLHTNAFPSHGTTLRDRSEEHDSGNVIRMNDEDQAGTSDQVKLEPGLELETMAGASSTAAYKAGSGNPNPRDIDQAEQDRIL